MNYPLHLTSTALQLLQLAALRGLGKEPDIAVSKIWDGLERETFPRAKTERA
jgi:3-hydroxyisobutyrate dehydrogenase